MSGSSVYFSPTYSQLSMLGRCSAPDTHFSSPFLSHTQTPNKQVGEIFLNYFLKVSSTVGSIVGGGEPELASKHIRLPG